MVNQYEIYWVNLNPTVGSEINKPRPAVVISPNESNMYLKTVLIVPVTSTKRNFPMRVDVALNGKKGQVALDQIRCIDKSRIQNLAGKLTQKEVNNIKKKLKKYLVD